MKTNKLFDELLSQVPKEIMEEVSLSFDIAKRISLLLKQKGMTQSDLASKMGKSEGLVSRWLSGTHNFTIQTLAEIATALNAPIVKCAESEKLHTFTFTSTKTVSYRNRMSVRSVREFYSN